MFTSPKLPESSSVRRRLSDSTFDTYSDFRNHLLSNEEPSDFEDDIQTLSPNNTKDARQLLPIDLKLQKPLNRLLSDVQAIKRSNVAGVNKRTKKETETSNIKETVTKMKPAANALNNTRVTRSTTRNKENNLPASSKAEKQTKRKLFETETLSKLDSKKPKTAEDENNVMNQTNKLLTGLSDTAVSLFLQNFDEEMAHESGSQSVKSLVNGSARLSTPDLPEAEHSNIFKQPNHRCYKKLPKRKCADRSQKTEAQLYQEELASHSIKKDYDSDDSLHDKDFKINECSSTSNESDITDEGEDIEKKKGNETFKKIDFLVKEERSSIFNDTNSISSIGSSTSRYGRVRNTPPVYINATMFRGNSRKSAEVKQSAATLINSHRCKSRSSISIQDTSRFSSDQFSFISPIHKGTDSPEFKSPANQITPSRNGPTTRRAQSRRLSSTSQKSCGIENRPDKQTPHQFDFLSPTHSKAVSFQLKTSANQTASSTNGSNLSNSRRSRSRSGNTPRKASFITDSVEKPSLNQSDSILAPPHLKRTSPRFNQTTPSTSSNKMANSSSDEVFNKNCSVKKETSLKICKLDSAHDTCLTEELIFEKPLDRSTCSSQNDETSKSQKIVIHQNVLLRPPIEEEKPVEHVKPSIHNLRRNTSLSRTSQSSISQPAYQTSNNDLENLFDDRERIPDPNEIHAVVNDEVVSFKWYAPKPNFDSVLSNANVHYSMLDLKSFYTNVKVGYLKIDAGRRKLMKVLRDSIMLYFVERGEAIFRVSERERVGQIGSTFFIPLGVEYTITNLKAEILILKFVKMSSTATVL